METHHLTQIFITKRSGRALNKYQFHAQYWFLITRTLWKDEMLWPTFFTYLLRGLPFCCNSPCRKISDILPYMRNCTRKRILLFNAVPLRQTNFFRFFLHPFVELYNCVPDLDVIEMMNSRFVVNAARPSAPTSSGRETISNNRRLFWRLNET